MKKKLTAKVQQLNPTLPQYSGSFSKCVVIEPETKEVQLKKGAVYAVFNIQGEASFDTELVYKVTNDVIHNSYYQSDNISPIQSMEKAIAETRDKIAQLSSDVLRSDQQAVKINLIAAVLWGNVMYFVKYGEMGCFLMREGIIKPVNMVSEGNFCAFSLVVNDDDVVILCSSAFEKELPPEKLLSTNVSEQSLKPDQTCLLLKLLVDSSFTGDEVVDFGLEKAITKNKSRAAVEKFSSFFAEIFAKLPKPKVAERITNISLPKVNRSPRRSNFKFQLWMLTPIALIILGVGIYFITKIPKVTPSPKTPTPQSSESKTVQTTQSAEPQPNILGNEIRQQNDAAYKVARVNPEVFYDLKITDPNVQPTELVSFTSTIAVTDATTGKIYVSDRNTPKFTAQAKVFPGIRSCINSDGKLSFLDNTGYKLYNQLNSTVSSEGQMKADLAIPYSGFIYTLSSDTINKYTLPGSSPTVWGQSELLKNAKSMTIAYNIYVITSDNKLISFSAGKQTNFAVKGLENGFANGVKVVADLDLNNIYIADKGNKSVAVLDDKGSLIKQYKTEKDETWADLKGIAVSPDEKILYVLSGSKVYQIDLSK